MQFPYQCLKIRASLSDMMELKGVMIIDTILKAFDAAALREVCELITKIVRSCFYFPQYLILTRID